jgi:transcriptional regulator of met regulon
VRASALWSGDRRIEAESYLTEGYLLRQRIERIGAKPLEHAAKVWQPSRLKGIQVSRGDGVPFLAATQVLDTRPTPRKWLSARHTPDVAQRYVHDGWILVTCSGSVGDAIMAYRPLENVVISHDLLRVVPHNSSDTGFLYAFLRTHHARGMMRSTKYGNVIKHLEPSHLDAVLVPSVGDRIKEILKRAISKCFALRSDAFDLICKAEATFANAIGPVDVEAAELGFPVMARDMFHRGRRLDAYSYNPAAGAALKAIERSRKPVESLERATNKIFGVARFKHIYTATGTPYLDSEDLFKINPEITKFIPRTAKKDAEKYFVEPNWLLVACSGQIYGLNGSVTQATEWHQNKIVSNHVLRIVPGSVRSGYLRVALGHPILGRPLVLREVFGTSIPEIDPESLRDFPVVRLGALEDEIADQAERCMALQTFAENLENAATSLMESVIWHALGDVSEDDVDASLARVRLAEIEASPESVVTGDALKSRLARLNT